MITVVIQITTQDLLYEKRESLCLTANIGTKEIYQRIFYAPPTVLDGG